MGEGWSFEDNTTLEYLMGCPPRGWEDGIVLPSTPAMEDVVRRVGGVSQSARGIHHLPSDFTYPSILSNERMLDLSEQGSMIFVNCEWWCFDLIPDHTFLYVRWEGEADGVLFPPAYYMVTKRPIETGDIE